MVTKEAPRGTITAMTLELIQSGGPITTEALIEEIHTLQRNRVLVTDPGYVRRVTDAVAFHAGKGTIKATAAGWEYVPPAGEPAKKRKPQERQKGLGFE